MPDTPENQMVAPVSRVAGAAPAAPQSIPITEVQYLKFMATKSNDELLKIQRAKLDSDRKVLEVSEENLQLKTLIIQRETQEIYKDLGVIGGDQVIETNSGEHFIVRKAPKIQGNGQ